MDSAIDLQADFLKWMCNHLVALVARYEIVDEQGAPVKRGFKAFSGFIIQVQGGYYWVTAGHCIRILENDLLSNNRVNVWDIGFMDRFGDHAAHEETLPFHYDVGDAIWVDKRTFGYDFAIVPLADFEWRGLEKNGIRAVTRDMWHERPERNYFDYKVLGLPEDYIEQMTDRPTWGARPVAAGIERLTPFDAPEPVAASWFVGRLKPDAVELADIVGMSGGPIFAFWKDETGNTRYGIVAVQSAWYDQSRIILGCPLSVFAEVMHRAIEADKRKQEKEHT